MVTLVDLPHHVLETIFTEINQHQALALAPLHSSLQVVAKLKLYKHIHVYEVHTSPKCQKPSIIKYSFPKNLNNPTANKFTIISIDSIKKYLTTMDATQPITCLEYPLLDCRKIRTHFKRIKNFYHISLHEKIPDYFRADGDAGVEFPKSSCSGCAILSEADTWVGDTRRNIPHVYYPTRASHPQSPFMKLGKDDVFANVTDLNVRVPRSNLIQKRYECQLKLKRLKIELTYDVLSYDGKFRIDKIFSTTDLRELYIAGSCNFDELFSTTDIDASFPKLIQLGLRITKHSHYWPVKICTIKHKYLKKIIVSTSKADTKTAQNVCKLTVQFPNAGIHWWRSYDYYNGPARYFVLEQQSWFSPQIDPGCVGFHWSSPFASTKTYNAMDKLECKVERLDSSEKNLVTLKRCYTIYELRAMFALYDRKIYDLEELFARFM